MDALARSTSQKNMRLHMLTFQRECVQAHMQLCESLRLIASLEARSECGAFNAGAIR